MLPSVLKLRNSMQDFSKILYNIWRHQFHLRLTNLVFKGYICIDLEQDYTLSDGTVYKKEMLQLITRLPNRYIMTALAGVQDELEYLGYDFTFKFNDVSDNEKWALTYDIELPEDDDEKECLDFFIPPHLENLESLELLDIPTPPPNPLE